jgi:hypothetical protein
MRGPVIFLYGVSMLASMPFAKGLPGPTTTIRMPTLQMRAVESVSVVGDTLVASPVRVPAVTWTEGIEVSHQGVAIASAYAGTTRVIVLMSSGPGNNPHPAGSAAQTELRDVGTLVVTKAILETCLAETVVADLVQLHTPESGRPEDGVDRLMTSLGGFALRYPYEGCLLMVALYPLAGDLYLHGECEAVDEYIYHLHPAGLETRLRGFAAQPSDPHEMRKKYLEWADCIAESATKNQPDQT